MILDVFLKNSRSSYLFLLGTLVYDIKPIYNIGLYHILKIVSTIFLFYSNIWEDILSLFL